jgi:transposase
MAKKTLAVHVARIKACKKGKHYETVLLRHSYREGGKVKHLTIANLSDLQPDLVDAIERVCKGETLVSLRQAFSIQRSLPHGHVAAVLGTVRRIGLDRVITARRSPKRDAILALIAQRVIDPAPKLATARALHADTAQNSLSECLNLGGIDEDDLYDAMDWLLTQQRKIESSLAKKHLEDGALVLYDLTSTYFEGRTCPLAKRGYSRDGKPGKLQIEFGLLCNAEGCPVAVEVFEGDVADPLTVRSQVEKLREQFGLRRVVVVGDRGMLTEARIREDLRPGDIDWVTSLRAPAIRSLVEQGALQLSLFDERDLMEITSSEYPGERLVVCRNPLLAEDRRRRREELLRDTEAALAQIAAATRRSRNPLVGQEAIGLRVGKVINRHKVAKHFVLEIGADGFSYSRDEAKIAAEAALDGFYVIRTSVPAEELGPEETVAVYKGLSRVERAFRSLKTVDLKVRPIHHRLADRVRAHVFLCVLAYYVEWHMRQWLAPLLFDDERPEEGVASRASVVAPARRSESAELKARTKRTEDGLPVHSFRTLLSDLSTLTKNRCIQAALGEAYPIEMLSEPTAVQRRAFELLGVLPMV